MVWGARGPGQQPDLGPLHYGLSLVINLGRFNIWVGLRLSDGNPKLWPEQRVLVV